MGSPAIGGKAHWAMIWLPWILFTLGWIILLSGVAVMQSACSASYNVTALVRGGSVGYLAPVDCSKFFRYAWWATFYSLAVWAVVLATLITTTIHKFRPGLVGLLSITIMLLMGTANTFLFFNDVQTGNTTFKAGTRTTVAGAVITTMASFVLVILIGLNDEDATWHEGHKATRAAVRSTASPTPSKATSTTTFEARGLPATTGSPAVSSGGR